MLAALLILPVISGYIVVNSYPPYKFASARENKHRLYFRCIQIGLILTILSTFTHYVFYVLIELCLYKEITAVADQIFKPKNSANDTKTWSVGGIAIILFWTYIYGCAIRVYNTLYKKFRKEDYNAKLTEWHEEAIKDNQLLKLASEHSLDEKQNSNGSSLMFTLNTGKIYIGWVKQEPEPSNTCEFLRILPLISGYRDKESQKENFVSFYDAVIDVVDSSDDKNYTDLNKDSFDIVFPIDAIVSVHPFQIEAYKLFKEQELGNGKK